MSSNFLNATLGTSTLNVRTQKLARNYLSLSSLMFSLNLMADGFLILYILDTIGYGAAGLFFGTRFICQAVIDYPTGVLADWIGHKRVILIAYIFHFGTFVLIGSFTIIDPAREIGFFLIVAVLRSIALAQESGALQSWFDNAYKQEIGDLDPKREMYSVIFGRTMIFQSILGIITIVLGGLIAQQWGRETLFIVQAIVSLLLGILGYKGMSGFAEKQKPILNITNYTKLLIDGVKVTFQRRIIFFLASSFVVLNVFMSIWGAYFLFPIYFGYTGKDTYMAILRTVIFAIGVPLSIFSVTISKRLDGKVWIPRLTVIFAFGWSSIYVILFKFYPLPLSEDEAKFSWLAIVIVILAAMLLNVLSTVFFILYQKLVLDLIPDDNRNSYNSLLPTIGLLLASGLIILAGKYIESSQNMLNTFVIFLFIPAIIAMIFSFIAFHNFEDIDIPEVLDENEAVYVLSVSK
jgi:MFS family permease